MPGNTEATVYMNNLDDRVDERMLYEIMVQAGPLVEVYIPRDKETKRHKGYAFAEYKTEESAAYALKLFSGLVTLYNRSVRFAISGGEKISQTKEQTLDRACNKHQKSQENSPGYDRGHGLKIGSAYPGKILTSSYNSRLASASHRSLRVQPSHRYSPY